MYDMKTKNAWSRCIAGAGPVVVFVALSGCGGDYESELETDTEIQTEALSSGDTIQLVGVASGHCIGIGGSSTSAAANAQIQGCNGGNSQKWIATRDAAGYYELKNVNSGLCLDVNGRSNADGASLIQWTCSGADNQKWNIASQGGGQYGLVAKHSGKAAQPVDNKTVNGTRLVQATWTASSSQKFTIPSSSPVTGFASTDAQGLSTTTGGGSATPVTVSTCSALKTYLEDSTARVVQLASGSTLDCRTSGTTLQACQIPCDGSSSQVFWRVPVGSQTCADLGGGYLVNKTRNEYPININSNKTLVGLGSGATLKGVSLGINGKSNIIVRNVTVSEVNPSLIEAGDGIGVNNSHHVWVDHVKFSMVSDGYFDIKSSQAVTVSYSHIDGLNSYTCGGKHHYVAAIDASDATLHHNYFDNSSGRNPKVTGASRVHLYSNYYTGIDYFCSSFATSSQGLVQGNYFNDSRYPHWSEGGSIEASGNVYAGKSADANQKRDGGANVFDPPYSYSVDNASNLPSTIPSLVGPHSL
jgi:pectate lyase